MRILWHSNGPHVGSGYGSQTALFAPRIAKELGHEVAISAFWGILGGSVQYDGLTVYPGDGTYGGLLPVYATDFGRGDPLSVTILTLLDVWAFGVDPGGLNPVFATLPLASWVPVDHEPTPEMVRKFFELTGAVPIAMSRFGERMLRNDGLDPLYVPHGIDTQRLQPWPKDVVEEARASFDIPKDAFVVGMVAANQGDKPPRKAFPHAFAAFAKFKKTHPDALLYLHTMMDEDKGPGRRNGIDLWALANAVGVPHDSIRYTPELKMRLGLPYEAMGGVYSMFDVLLSPSYGEGFGIPIIEAQACGVPVIVNDFSAMPELCGAGWKVEGSEYFDFNHGGGASYFQEPNIDSIVEALEHAYDKARDPQYTVQARTFAEQYDVQKVLYEHWVPALAEIEARLDGKRAAARQALAEWETKPNRAQRRAAAKAA